MKLIRHDGSNRIAGSIAREKAGMNGDRGRSRYHADVPDSIAGITNAGKPPLIRLKRVAYAADQPR